MSTTINVTVDDGGLPAKNRQQTAANRQAFVQGGASQQAAQRGADQRAADRRAAGLDPTTGRPTGSSSRLPRVKQEPAANRGGERFIQVFPPTAVLPASPLPPDVQPEYQASIRQWWQVQQSGISQPVGFGDVQGFESAYFKNPLIYSTGNYVTVDPTVINTVEPVGIILQSGLISRLKSSAFTLAGREPREFVFSGILQTPPLGDEFSTGPVSSAANIFMTINLLGNPLPGAGIGISVGGQNIQPINVLTADGSITSINIEPSSPLTYRFRVGPNGVSTATINGTTLVIPNRSIWSPAQSYTLECTFFCEISRSALASPLGGRQPWPAVPESAGLIGTTRVSFR